MTDPKLAQECARQLQAIAEPNRIRIIDCLRTGQKNVTQLATLLDVEIVNVSHHLGVMRAAGIVQDRKDGRFVIYALAGEYKVSGDTITLSGPEVKAVIRVAAR